MKNKIKGYKSIPHLSLSTITSDKDIYLNKNLDEKFINWFWKNKKLYITIKYDGSNCWITRLNGELIMISRNGYIITDWAYPHYIEANKWLQKNKEKFNFLNEWDKLHWELLNKRIRIKYDNQPFIRFFDMFQKKDKGYFRISYNEFISICNRENLDMVELLPFNNWLEAISYIDNIPNTEWIVLRVEWENWFEHIAKYVKKSYKQLKLYL